MRAEPTPALRFATYAVVADGVLALHLSRVLAPVGIAVVTLAIVATWWGPRACAALGRVRGGPMIPAVVAGAVAVLDVAYVAGITLEGLVHALLVLLVYRLFTLASLRDVRDVAFLGFFMLVAAAPGTVNVAFCLVLVAFVVVATGMLVLRHVVAASETASMPAATAAPISAGRIVLVSTAASAMTLVITALLFFVIPRAGQAAFPVRTTVGRMISGFSDHVVLGSFGDIEPDSTVVMRVRVRGSRIAPTALSDLRWRGVALDRFDGRAWRVDRRERVTVHRAGGGFDVDRPRGTGLIVVQDVYLEPIGTDVVFAAPRLLRLTARSDAVAVDAGGSVTIADAAARLHYTAESEIERLPPRRSLTADETLDDASRARYLELPPVAPRVATLARTIVGDAGDPYERARRLVTYLSTRYRYTRALERRTALSPVEDFLFESRRGNCEYFAAALVVMLRTLGVPARVVNGFQRGAWNPYGGYFMVRLLDAHSWVEAWIDDAGWVTLDPSPRGTESALRAHGTMPLYLDALRMRWYRYVVAWSLDDQMIAASRVRDAAATWAAPVAWPDGAVDVRRTAWGLFALIAAVVALTWWLRARRRRRLAHDVPVFYSRMLRLLARRGLRPDAGETAREFTVRAGRAVPPCTDSIAAITAAYERVRFGAGGLTATDAASVSAAIATLRGA